MEATIYERNLEIPHYLGDRYHRIKLPHLMNVLIEVSGEQTAQVSKVPVEDLGLHWIVVQYEVDVKRLPQTKETIRVRTFTQEHNRIFSYREFEVYDEEDNLLLHVMSVFALIDENRKLSRIPSEIIEGYGSTENRRIRRMPKPDLPAEDNSMTQSDYRVGYFDIDTNFHANNSMYFMWMLEALGDEFLATHNPVYGNITFEKEVHINDHIESYVDVVTDEDDVLTSRHSVQVGDIIKCKATFKWEENNVDYSDHKN